MIIMMKNGSLAKKETVSVPHSKLKEAILRCLKKEGYISDFSKKIVCSRPSIDRIILSIEISVSIKIIIIVT